MTRSEFLEFLKDFGVSEKQFQRCVRTNAFRKKFKVNGTGYSHDYGKKEADAIINVILKKEAWEKAMRFE